MLKRLVIITAGLAGCVHIDTDAFDVRVDADGDGLSIDDDCDDDNATVGLPVPWWEDGDGDGFGGGTASVSSCDPVEGRADADGDCDDANPAVHPGAAEVCNNHVDDDCSGDAPQCALTGEYSIGQEMPAVFGAGFAHFLGSSLATPADVDSDGAIDWFVGAPNADPDLFDTGSSGAAYIVRGPRIGGGNVLDQLVASQIGGPTSGSGAGQALAFVGDFAGGDPTWAIGAPHADGAELDAGMVSFGTGRVNTALGPITIDLLGDRTGDLAGFAIAGGTDLDGDGASDVVIGAPGVNAASGNVYLVRGPLVADAPLSEAADAHMVGPTDTNGLGRCVATVGDLDGDGAVDMAASGSTNDGEGAVWLVSGDTRGSSPVDEVAWSTVSPPAPREAFGNALVGGSDLDGDGLSELVVGAPESDRGATLGGAVYVVSGAGGHVEFVATWLGTTVGAMAGTSVAIAGDQDADGTEDLIIGGPEPEGPGRAWLVSGARMGDLPLDLAMAHFAGDDTGDGFGAAVAGGVDIDADGYPDLLVGAPSDDSAAPGAGAVYMFRGSGM